MKKETTLKVYALKKNETEFKNTQITSSESAANFIRQFYSDDIEIFESFFLVLLNRANITTGYVKISTGGLAATLCDPILIAKYAVDTLSSSVILCHNHPSGNLQPSQADKNLTEKVKNTLALFDCKVLDHIILTTKGYYSFMDEGLL